MRLLSAIAVAALYACTTAGSVAGESRPRPNILFILIDDMGYADLTCYGGTRAKTPEIDRLAREGIRFTRFYVNAPICSASRVALTTGQYPGRWKITSYLDTRRLNRQRGMKNWLAPRAPSLARTLAAAGWYAAHVGKWHMGGQRDVGDAPLIQEYGFARSLTNFEGLGERLLPVFEPVNGKELNHVPTKMSARLPTGPIHDVPRHEVTERFVDRALEEIKAAVARHQPFYINLWPDDVHSPMQAPPGKRRNGSPADQYVGVLEELDRQLGRVFAYIRSESALRDNTLILLTSDNGPEPGLGSAGELRGAKAMLYEGGIRSPLIVWSSRIGSGAVGSTDEQTLLAGMDLPPSLLAISGVAASDAPFDGIDRSRAILGRPVPERGAPIMWVRPPDRPGPRNNWPDLAIREGNWKLLVFRDGSKAELYNLAEDPNESRNLAAENAELTQRLTEQVIAWDKATQGD